MPDDDRALLLEAIRGGDVPTVERLLASDSGLASARDDDGVPAVLVALYHRQPGARDAVLRAGPDIGVLEAAALGRAGTLRELLAADPGAANVRSPDGFTALGYACFFGGPDAVRVLLDAGADPSAAADNTLRVAPLHSAAARGDVESARMLLDAGADPDARQQAELTALHAAAQADDAELARLLLDRGADPSLTDERARDSRALAGERVRALLDP